MRLIALGLLVGLLSVTAPREAKAQELEILLAWVGVVTGGALVLTCSAKVLGDFYQGICEAGGGVYERVGTRWRCSVLPFDRQSTEREVIDECVTTIIGGPA